MAEVGEKTELVRGSCFCGAVQFEFALPTLFCGHCHCSMCRRAHGAGYVTWIGVSTPKFSLTAGQDRLAVFVSSEHGRRSFCNTCGSSLFCQSSRHPEVMDIVLANLHAAIDRQPQAHYYFSDRADWVAIGDALPRFGGETGTERLAAESAGHMTTEKHA